MSKQTASSSPIPYSELRRVRLDGSSSQQKRAVISGVRYESATRVYLQTKSRFGVSQRLNGFVTTDLPIGYVLDFTKPAWDAGILATECRAHTPALQPP
jgi:monoamine oxidase